MEPIRDYLNLNRLENVAFRLVRKVFESVAIAVRDWSAVRNGAEMMRCGSQRSRNVPVVPEISLSNAAPQ